MKNIFSCVSLALVLATLLSCTAGGGTRGAVVTDKSGRLLLGVTAQQAQQLATFALTSDSSKKHVIVTNTITYPFDGAVLPLGVPAPTIVWEGVKTSSSENSDARSYVVAFYVDNNLLAAARVETSRWQPSHEFWNHIEAQSVASTSGASSCRIVVYTDSDLQSLASTNSSRSDFSGLSGLSGLSNLSGLSGSVAITFDPEPVAYPIMYQDIPLPFAKGKQKPENIKWRLGYVSEKATPDVVIENLSSCGNCHTFSGDGSVFGMDIDRNGDKGGYLLVPLEGTSDAPENTSGMYSLGDDNFISWNTLPHTEELPSMGLFTKISHDGTKLVSTVNDQPFMVVYDDPEYTQLFFPISGKLAVYDRSTKRFGYVEGAADDNFIQTSPVWSPDSKHIVFSRAKKDMRYQRYMGTNRAFIASPEERIHELNSQMRLRFDLYRIAWDGDTAPEPIVGGADNGKSNYFPRYTPDGKFIIFTQADGGLVSQPGSQLMIVPAEGGTARPLNSNLTEFNSWHSISPDGKWLAFSGKYSFDGSRPMLTRVFLARLYPDGTTARPFMLEHFASKGKASNMPEFANIRAEDFTSLEVQ